jgi:hypothetical protein
MLGVFACDNGGTSITGGSVSTATSSPRPTGAVGASTTSAIAPGEALQVTTTGFWSSAGPGGTDQVDAMTSGGELLNFVRITGVLVRTSSMSLGGGASMTTTDSFDINGTMIMAGGVGPSTTLNGTGTVSIVQNGVIDVPKQGSGFTNWTGTDKAAVFAAWPLTGGTLNSTPGFNGQGTITFNCKGSGSGNWPGQKKAPSALTEYPGVIDFIISIEDGHISIAVQGDYQGNLSASY